MSDPLADLSAQDVSIWLDDISRERLRTGNLQELIDTKHVVGVTSNPTIFQKALEKGDAYDDQVRDLKVRKIDLDQAIRELMAFDIRWACDVLRPVFDRTDGKDGRVSIEVDPRLAHDTERTTAEAKALWWLVDRPNVMIKIPASKEGLPSITAATAAGINVNVTLIFGLDRYDARDGCLPDRSRAGQGRRHRPVDDPLGRLLLRVARRHRDRQAPRQDRIARGGRAARQGRHRERPAWPTSATRRSSGPTAGRRSLLPARTPSARCWASTGVKDPAYDDTMYVVQLVAPDTVNTMPEATLNAVADHGKIAGDAIAGTYDDARKVIDALNAIDVTYDDVIEVLETEGVQKFEDSYAQLAESVKSQLDAAGS